MKSKKTRIVIGALLITFGAVGGVLYLYKDRALEAYWIASLKSSDRETVRKAGEQLAETGSVEALGPLLEAIAWNGEYDAWSKDGSGAHLRQIDSWIRLRKGFGLWALQAVQEIRNQGEDPLPALAEALRSDHWEVTNLAVYAITKMGESAASIAPSIVSLADRDITTPVPKGAKSSMAMTYWNQWAKRLPEQWIRSATRAILPGTDATTVRTLIRQIPPGIKNRFLAARALGREVKPNVLRELLKDEDPSIRLTAITWTKMGTWPVAEIIETLPLVKDRSTAERSQFIAALQNGNSRPDSDPRIVEFLIEQLHESDEDLLIETFELLAHWSNTHAAAAQAIKRLTHPSVEVRAAAADAISSMEPPPNDAIPDLIALLKDEGSVYEAAWALSAFGHAADSAAPAIIEQLTPDCPRDLVEVLLETLGHIATQSNAELVASAIQPWLQGEHAGIAATTLGSLGTNARSAVPKLLPLITDLDWEIAHIAIEAIVQIGSTNADAVQRIREGLKKDSIALYAAVPALLSLGATRQDVAAIIHERLKTHDEDDESASDFAMLLSLLGYEASESVPRIFERLTKLVDDDPDEAWSCCDSTFLVMLATLPRPAKEVDSLLDAHMKTSGKVEEGFDGDYTGWDACYLLNSDLNVFVEIGRYTPTEKLRALLLKSASQRLYSDRAAAARGLGLIDAGPKTDATLLELVDDRHHDVRRLAAESIGKRNKPSDAAITGLLERSREADCRIREAAATSLGQISDGDPATLDRLEELLTDEVLAVRIAAIAAFGEIGPASGSKLRVIAAQLNHSDEKIKRNTLRSLGMLGPPAREAIATIAEFASHSTLGRHARRALSRIGERTPPEQESK